MIGAMTTDLTPRRRPMVGFILDQEEEPDQATPRWRDILAFARGAEAIGIDSLWLVDHFVWSADPWGRRAEAVDATDTGGPRRLGGMDHPGGPGGSNVPHPTRNVGDLHRVSEDCFARQDGRHSRRGSVAAVSCPA
jgi:hypothetical protein